MELELTFGWLERLFGERKCHVEICGSGGCWYYFPSGASCPNHIAFSGIEAVQYIRFNDIPQDLNYE